MSSGNESNGNTLLWRVFQIANLTADEAKNTFSFITTTITNAVITAICKAFDVENLTALAAKLEPKKAAALAIDMIGKELDSKIKAALADPARLRPLVEAIAMDPEAQRILVDGCNLNIANQLRMLLDNMPQDLVDKVAMAAKQENKEFIRQALPLAFKQLGWGEPNEADFSKTAVADAHNACIAEDASSVEPIVTKLVEWLPNHLARFKTEIVRQLGYKLVPAHQVNKIDELARNAYVTGLPIKDIVDQAVAKGDLKRNASGLKSLRQKESSGENPAADLNGLSDFAGETESETK